MIAFHYWILWGAAVALFGYAVDALLGAAARKTKSRKR